MVVVSCSGKFHAFNLAEQLACHGLLYRFYTRYAYQRNTSMHRFVSRVDKEVIPVECIRTMIPLAIADKLKLTNTFINNDLFDRWVARQLKTIPADYRVFIGWSGMALRSIRQAKKDGKITIVERGSAHILAQEEILVEEYSRYGKAFRIDSRTVDKELQEYDEADYISIPSDFVRQTFLQKGIQADKLLINPYGVSTYFTPRANEVNPAPFVIVYLGSLTIRKGLLHLFRALQLLTIDESKYVVWFIGKVDEDVKEAIQRYKKNNWTFWGHINHYELATYLRQTSVAVQPSVEEGLSMIIPQMMACGVPVIATTNTGVDNVVVSGSNGYVVPIRDPDSIAQHLTFLYENPEILKRMQLQAIEQSTAFSWSAYGERYVSVVRRELSKNVIS